jgi:predicted enzyme related to lactoylglutathione lyase
MNQVGYFEIQSDNPEKSVAFYSEVFGWKFFKDTALPIDYWQIQTEGINGGLLKRPAKKPAQEQGTNAFCCSMQVEDFDKTAQKILKYGGVEALPKFAIPGRCWQGYFMDVDGNVFGLFQVDGHAI